MQSSQGDSDHEQRSEIHTEFQGIDQRHCVSILHAAIGLTQRAICQACGASVLQNELTLPFGASSALVCRPCMLAIRSRIDQELEPEEAGQVRLQETRGSSQRIMVRAITLQLAADCVDHSSRDTVGRILEMARVFWAFCLEE